jgi:dolichol-phosphate mannosyltransferase
MSVNEQAIQKKLSIVIPCYNEEAGIPQLAQKLPPVLDTLKWQYDVELVFVDDGSSDNTYLFLRQYFPFATILKHEKNQNLGAALRTGFAYVTGDVVAALDSDCTYAPALLISMLDVLDENTAIVTVSPYHPHGVVENVPGYRLFLSKSVSLLYRIVLGQKLHTFTAMVRVYKRDVVKNFSITHNTFMGVTEILAKAVLSGCVVKEIPAVLRVRQYGTSKMKLAGVIRDHLKLLGLIILHRAGVKKL